MLVTAIRRCVPCNMRRIAACVTYRNKTQMRTARQYDRLDFLSASLPSVAACRTIKIASGSEPYATLPMLVDGAEMFKPSLFSGLHLLFQTFKVAQIDKTITSSNVVSGAEYAVKLISNALANADYDSLEGLVADDMIEVLRTKIETLKPEQRQLIAVNDEDKIFFQLFDLAATSEEDSVEFKVVCHYIPDLAEKKTRLTFGELPKITYLCICNYTFTRKYENNVGGSWMATFVNHFSIIM